MRSLRPSPPYRTSEVTRNKLAARIQYRPQKKKKQKIGGNNGYTAQNKENKENIEMRRNHHQRFIIMMHIRFPTVLLHFSENTGPSQSSLPNRPLPFYVSVELFPD